MSGYDYFLAEFHFSFLLDVVAFQKILTKSVKCTVRLSKLVVQLFVNVDLRGCHVIQVDKLLNCFQLCLADGDCGRVVADL